MLSLILFSVFISFVSAQGVGGCIAELTNGPNFGAPLTKYNPADFNVMVFGNFIKESSGDVEGRVFVQGNFLLNNGFSIGYSVITAGPNQTDYPRPYSLVVGNDLTWNNGALYPDGTPGRTPKEGIYVGGKYKVASYLQSRITGGPCSGGFCLNNSVVPVLKYFEELSSNWSTVTPNAKVTYSSGGLFISSSDPSASRYYINVPASVLAKGTFWSAQSVNVGAEFIVTITGSTVTFKGGNFPSIPKNTVFNLPDADSVVVENRAGGSFLAPKATLTQRGGDEVGFVIVKDIAFFVEAQKPKCSIQYCCKYCVPSNDFF